MLQIYIYNNDNSGFLDLNPGTVLDMESVTDLFDEELRLGEFSLPIEIPWTNRNRKIMGFYERLANKKAVVEYWRVDVYDDGLPEFTNAKMTILERAGRFTYTSGNFSATVSGSKGYFGSLIKNKKLQDVNWGLPVTYTGQSSRDFATDVMKGLHPELNIAFAPVAYEDFFKSGFQSYTDVLMAGGTANTIVITGSGADDWQFGRPDPNNPAQVLPIGVQFYYDYRSIPYFQLKYIIRKLFSSLGFKISGAILDSPDFDDLYIFNNFALESYYRLFFGTDEIFDYTDSIYTSNHLPEMLVSDFLRGIFNFFNMKASFRGSEVVLSFRENVSKTRNPLKMRADLHFESVYAEQQNKGYTLNYTWDTNDSYPQDRIKDITQMTLLATVYTADELGAIGYGYGTTSHIALVTSENMYYVIADSTTSPVVWEPWSERLQPYVKGEGENNIELGISTLCTAVELNTETELNERKPYVGCRQRGSYITYNRYSTIREPFGLRLFYIKKKLVGGNNIPVSFNHDTTLERYSLSLQGTEGIAENFHVQWQELKANMETIKTQIPVTRKTLEEFLLADSVEIHNVHVLPYKIERSVPLKGSLTAYLVPL